MAHRGRSEMDPAWAAAMDKDAGCGGGGGGGGGSSGGGRVEDGNVEGGAESKTTVAGQSEERTEVEARVSDNDSTRGGAKSQAVELSVVGAADDDGAAAETNGSATGDAAASGSETFVGTFCNHFHWNDSAVPWLFTKRGRTARSVHVASQEQDNLAQGWCARTAATRR